MRVRATLLSFFLVFAAYLLYGWVLVPLVLPTIANGTPPGPRTGGEEEEFLGPEELRPFLVLLPENGWERGADVRMLKFGQIVVLFETDTPKENKLTLQPCTILLLPDDLQKYHDEEELQNKIRQSVVMRTEQFAVIEFDRDFDLTKMPAPKPLSGRLEGIVTVQSNLSDTGTQDDFYLEADGIEISDDLTTIESLNDVRFSFGTHSGVGYGLTLKVAEIDHPQAQTRRELQSAVFNNIISLNLVFPESPGTATTIDVHCKGKFVFAANPTEQGWTASFYKDVKMTRNNPDKTSDQLKAEEVHLTLKAKPGETDGTKSSPFSNLEPALFVANGKAGQNGQPPIPAELSVKQGGDVTLIGDQIFLDLRTKYLSLSTRKGEGASPFVEMIVANQYKIRSAHLVEYTFGQDGAFGKFVSQGKGDMTSRSGEGTAARDIHLTWNEMQMGPHPTMKDQIILRLSKGISAKMTGFGTMTADTADLCCYYAGGDKQKNNNLTLDHAIVRDNVRFETAAGTCNVKQLQIFFTNIAPDGKILHSLWMPQMLFDKPPLAPGKSVAAQQPILQVQHLEPLKSQPMQPIPLYSPSAVPVAAPVINNSRLPNSPSATLPKGSVETQNLLGMKSSPGGKFDMTGDLMRMEVVVRNGQSSAEVVSIEGNVRLKENVQGNVQNTAIEIAGDTVTIWNPADPTTQIKISGQATGSDAIFKGKGVELRAKELNMSRPDNMFWSPGTGRLIANTGQVSMTGVPTSNANNDKLIVEWNKEMRCDGMVIQFMGLPDRMGNRVRTTYQTKSLVCNEMQLRLNRKVMFFEDQSPVAPEAVEILCVHNVYVQNRTLDAQGRQKSLERGNFTKLQYNIEKDYFFAEGPGELSSVFLGAGQGFDPSNLAGTPAHQNNAEKLNYLAIWFPDTMHGTLLGNSKKMEIRGRKIKAAFCPAASWEDTVGIDNLSAARKSGYTMECEQLQVVEMPNPLNMSQSSMELTASHSAVIESDSVGIYGKAQTIKYNQAKSIVNMDGDVTIQITTQGKTSKQTGDALQYNIETKSLDYIRAKGLTIN